VYARPRSAQVDPETVLLRASRAADTGPAAAAGRPLRLEIETAEVSGESAYRVEVVDAFGRTEAAGPGRVNGGKLEFPIDRGLSEGRHFVRLYGEDGRLLREFALEAGAAL
jgi:hypothetical protein